MASIQNNWMDREMACESIGVAIGSTPSYPSSDLCINIIGMAFVSGRTNPRIEFSYDGSRIK